jgi:tetratricopeptide (TPR) repeat protein
LNFKKMTNEKTYLIPILIFPIFLATLHPSITAGDSGEISAAAFSLGIPHPSGYPLYVIIGKLFSLALPLGNVAYRVNVASAVFGALSCWMVYLITHKIVNSRGQGVKGSSELPRTLEPSNPGTLVPSAPALFAAFSLALSYEFWYRSTVAEVYTLNTFLILAIIYVLMQWKDQGSRGQGVEGSRREVFGGTPGPWDPRTLYLASFLLGLGIGNHHTIVLVMPGAVAFTLLGAKGSRGQGGKENPGTLESWNPRTLLLLTFFFLLGLSVYLYLPIRSSLNPFMDWGDPQNMRNFADVFTRRAYLPEGVERGWGKLMEQIKSFDPIYDFTPIGLFLGLFGVFRLWNRHRATWVLLTLTFVLASYGLIFLAGSSKGDMDLLKKFYLPAHAVFSIFMGVGMATGMAHGAWRIASYALRPLLYALCGVSLIWQFSTHFPRTANAANYLAYDYGMNELNSLREGAAYISKGEIKTFPLWYLQGVERYREDVNVITAYFLTQRWYLREVLRTVGVPRKIPQGLTYKQMLVDAIYRGNADKGVYTGFLDEKYIGNLLTYTQGITFQLYKNPEEKLDMDVWPRYQLRGLRRIEEGMDRGVVEILRDYASSRYNTGLEYYNEGDRERAMTEFEKSLALNPDDPDSLNNLAVLYAEKGIRLKEAEGMARRAFELYTGGKDKEMARETLEEVIRVQGAEGPRGRGDAKEL